MVHVVAVRRVASTPLPPPPPRVSELAKFFRLEVIRETHTLRTMSPYRKPYNAGPPLIRETVENWRPASYFYLQDGKADAATAPRYQDITSALVALKSRGYKGVVMKVLENGDEVKMTNPAHAHAHAPQGASAYRNPRRNPLEFS